MGEVVVGVWGATMCLEGPQLSRSPLDLNSSVSPVNPPRAGHNVSPESSQGRGISTVKGT